ncbi:MAG: AzlD domain-containing protein, partial [Desulfuromonadales bacterium]|nr:AzlD domain-containing protein [Desulfuromonadales bacterium]
VVDWLNFIPVAILAALVAPGLFAESGSRNLVLGRLELWVAIPTLVFALKTRSLGGTVVIGMLLYWFGGMLLD